MAGPRRRAREIALQILIQTDVNAEMDAPRALQVYFDHLADDAMGDGTDDDQPPLSVAPPAGPVSGASRGAPFDRAMVEEIVTGVSAHRSELDQIVQDLSRNWRLERMALVERNVIRLALYEMKFVSSVPTNVVLNEAIELTKRFGAAEGAAFVNGLLDRAATELQLRR